MVSRLELYLLGPYRAFLNEQPITDFRADSTRGLLAYLAMHPGIAFRREALATLLWSEHGQDGALVNLRQILAILRRLLGDSEAENPILEITTRTVCLNAEAHVWVDANRFRELAFLALPGDQESQANTENVLAMRQALEMYGGDILSDVNVSSSAFEEWLVKERENLHQHAVDLLERLTEYHAARDEAERVRLYAQRHLEMDAWSEEAYYHLMFAYAQLGQRSAALKQYARCQRALLSAFGVEPGERIKALYRKIAEDDLAGI
jgi:DNA-binding SARP family transcriptional activator